MEVDLSIQPNCTIVEALKKLDQTAEKVLFVTDETGKLLGSLSDGDIRRYILSRGKIEGLVSECYNKFPVYIQETEYSDELIKKIMLERRIQVIPIVNSDGVIQGYKNWSEVFGSERLKNKQELSIPVVIMAGGKGKRLEPLTKIIPKPLIPIGEKTMIEQVIESFRNYGVKKFFVTINYKGELIESYFKSISKDYEIEFIRENDFLGTAGSLYYLKQKINTDFIVSNCDIVLQVDYSEVYNYHVENKSMVTSITSIKHVEIPYGVVEIDEGGIIKHIIEKPEYSFQINTGVYVLSSDVFKYISEETYLDMPVLLARLLENGEKVLAYPINERDYMDFGQWEEYKRNLRILGE
jgi:dTDP-glucose pyrophosphorylase